MDGIWLNLRCFDFDSFSWLTENFKDTIVCGDDLYATNPERLKVGIEKNATNAILIKPNQIGTLTDTFEATENQIQPEQELPRRRKRAEKR